MSPVRAERRLAAILAADVVGYSRLMAADETGTYGRLRALRQDELEPAIAAYHGRIVKLMGDGVLADFASAVDAVECAAEIQKRVAERQADVPGERRIALRVGVNVGDVIVEGNDIYGGGVNVAARLEGLAEPGGICVSQNVYSEVRDKVAFAFEPAGEHHVKNIPEPVVVYRLLRHPGPVARTFALKRAWTPKRRAAALAASVFLLFGAGGLVWLNELLPGFSPATEAGAALPLPDKPSIAVLPFDNLSDDPQQEYFADGMTEDLITDLAKIDGLFVIARNSTFAYKDQAVDVRQVAEELGVRYLLEGSVRRAGDDVRINAQLVDATTGAHVWADRYDDTFGDIFGLQDQVVEKIVAALSVELPVGRARRSAKDEPAVPAAYDAFLRGRARYQLGTPDDFAAAVAHFERAVGLDPDYGRAHAALAAVYAAIVDKNWSTGTSMWSHRLGMRTDEVLELEERHLEQALEDPTPLAHQVAAMRLSRQGRHEQAVVHAERALALDPNDPKSHQAMAAVLTYVGRPADAAEHIAQAMRLDPRSPHAYLYWLGLAQFGMERFEDAAATLERAAAADPHDDRSLIVLAAAYGHLDRVAEAKAAMEQANEIRSARQEELGSDLRAGIDALLVGAYSLKDVDLWFFAREADRERLRKGLAQAGVPEAGSNENESPLAIPGATTVDLEAAKALFDRGVTFVDVRGDGSWANGHIPGAVHLDLKKDFSERALSRVAEKDEDVVIYCMGPRCLLSSEACRQAVAWGFRNVHYFREGFPAWKAAGLPVAVPQKDA